MKRKSKRHGMKWQSLLLFSKNFDLLPFFRKIFTDAAEAAPRRGVLQGNAPSKSSESYLGCAMHGAIQGTAIKVKFFLSEGRKPRDPGARATWKRRAVRRQILPSRASAMAFESWSGQEVPFWRQRFPVRMPAILAASWPSTSLAIPLRLPSQPPVNLTLWSAPCSSMSKSMIFEQVPRVWYE